MERNNSSITPAEIEQVLKSLADTPDHLAEMIHGIKDDRLYYGKLDPEAWSVNDILAHLRSCAVIWGGDILKMITLDHPTLRYISPRTWIRKTEYLKLEIRTSLAGFIKQREELLKSLKALKIEGWARGATFTGTVKGREQTVLSYARRIAQHEIDHCEQVAAILKYI